MEAVVPYQNGGRVPPQAVEVEESVLGACLIESAAIDETLEVIQAADMYKTHHRHIMEAIIELHIASESVDLITVEQNLKDKGLLDMCGGPTFLSDLTRSVSSSANVKYHAQIIKEKALKRKVILSANDLIKRGYDTEKDAYDLVDEFIALGFALIEQNAGAMHDVADVMQRALEMIVKVQVEQEALGYESGLDIDTLINTWMPSKLYVIGARPSMGKTAFVITLMKQFARRGVKNGLLSLETDNESIGVRLLAQEANISAERMLKKGELSEQELKALMNAGAKLSEQGIIIDDSAGLTAQQVRSKCRMLVKKGCKVIFIDFLTLIKTQGRSKHEEVGEVTKMCKSMSKEMGVPIILLSQLSRDVEKRSNRRPQLSDLRESGSIEEDADVIMFLYRDEYYGVTTTPQGRSTEGILEIIVAKNKNGKVGMKKQYFDKETMNVKNLDFQHKYNLNESAGF